MFDLIKKKAVETAVSPYTDGEKKINGIALYEYRAIRQMIKEKGRVETRSIIIDKLLEAYNLKKVDGIIQFLEELNIPNRDITALKQGCEKEFGVTL